MINACIKYQHGPYAFSVLVDTITDEILKERILEAIKSQFASFLISDMNKVAIEFHFTQDINPYFQHEHYTNIGAVQFASDSLKFVNSEVDFVYSIEDGIHRIYVQIKNNTNFKSNCRLLNKGYIDAIEKQVAVFYYRVFLIFTQLLNIEYNTTYIHGASISDDDNNAILFPADSGVGKSSMLFRLAKEGKYSYVADDLSIVDNEFNTYYSGRAISMKPYHLKNFPFLSKIVEEEMPKYQQVQWKLLKDNRLVFGMDPQILFSNKIKKKANLKKVIHLVNTNDKGFTLQDIDSRTIAAASANILMNELFLGYYNIYKALSIPGNNLFLSPALMYEKTFNHYMKLFEETETYLLLVPYMSNPNEMYEFLISQNIID